MTNIYEEPEVAAFFRSLELMVAERNRLREAIRKHRDQRGDDRCWLDDEELYKVLPEGYTPPARDSRVELRYCERYIASRHNPATTYVSPEREIEQLKAELNQLRQGASLPDLFQSGDHTLHSGSKSDLKIVCEALSDGSLATIARRASRFLPPFGSVEGVPTGGLRLAEAFKPYATEGKLLVVDDVSTTGRSLVEHRGDRDAVGFVIFCRGVTPSWAHAFLFVHGEMGK